MILTCADLEKKKKNTKKSYQCAVIKLLVPIKYQFKLFGKILKIWATVKSFCNTDNRQKIHT